MSDTELDTRTVSYIKIFCVQAVFFLMAFVAYENFVFTVGETDRAVVLAFGEPVREVAKPGLYVKKPAPFQNVVYLPKRLVMLDADPKSIITGDKKTLVIDDFVMVRITNGVKFLQQLKTMPNALTRVDAIAFDVVRSALGKHDLEKIINQERNSIMDEVTQKTNAGIAAFGLEAPLVRITRADLPPDNKNAVHQRMNAERKRISDGYRAEGNEEKTTKLAATDREVITIVAKGEQQALQIMGEGDAEATRIYNAAYNKDPKFFRLFRSLETARRSLAAGGQIRIIQSGKEPHLRGLFTEKDE